MENRRFFLIDIIKGIAMIMVIMVHYEQSFHICKWFQYLQTVSYTHLTLPTKA